MTVEITTTREEWAVRVVRYTGTRETKPQDDEAFARFELECMNTYLASLNEPTRREYGVESVELVRRTVTDFVDGSQYLTAWEVVAR